MIYFVIGYLEDSSEYERLFDTLEAAEQEAEFLNEQGCNVWVEECE